MNRITPENAKEGTICGAKNNRLVRMKKQRYVTMKKL
jgi:hypothetical protein